jgi:hypothetical protein
LSRGEKNVLFLTAHSLLGLDVEPMHCSQVVDDGRVADSDIVEVETGCSLLANVV